MFLITFISRYFIFLLLLKNRMYFYWLSFRKAIDFCILLLLITLQNSLIVLNSRSADSLRIAVIVYANDDNFTASFPIFIPLVSFSYIILYNIKLLNFTTTVLNNTDDDGQLCVSFNFNERFSCFPIYSEATFGIEHI